MLFELTLIANFIIQHLVIGLGLFCLLTLITGLFRFTSELQSWLWITAFFLSTLVPFMSFIAPDANPPIQVLNQGQVAQSTPVVSSIEIKDTIAFFKSAQKTTRTDNRPFLNVSGDTIYRFTGWAYLLLGLWFLGACWRLFFVLRIVIGTQLLLRSEIRYAKPLKGLGKMDFPVLVSETIKSPMMMGFFNPTILIPKSLVKKLSKPQLNAIVLHEVAHVHRKDLWVKFFQETVSIVFWFSPVIRLLNKKINISRELACDMRAAIHLDSGKQYAESLLDCAQLMLLEKQNVIAMGLFSRKEELIYRVNEVLKMKYVKAPKVLSIFAVCSLVSFGSVALADAYAPKIKVAEVKRTTGHFANLSRAKGEMLMEALRENDLELLQFMMEYGLDINSRIMGDGTALMVSVKANNKKMVEHLIGLGADVNGSSHGDGNPLIVAAVSNNLDMAHFLLDQGASVNAIVEGDETPLINAARSYNKAMVELLVQRGADVNLGVNVPRPDGSTAYWTPLNRSTTPEIKDFLIQNGAR